jgi:hypothetical protein
MTRRATDGCALDRPAERRPFALEHLEQRVGLTDPTL